MFLAIDTCAWIRIYDHFLNIKIDFRPILQKFRLITTEFLQQEQQHDHLGEFIILNQILVPFTPEERSKYSSKYILEEFDDADQDLFIVGRRDGSTILTDDRDLFNMCKAFHIPVIQFWAFSLRLVKEDLLTKNQFHQCWKAWEKDKRYSKKTLKLLKARLKEMK